MGGAEDHIHAKFVATPLVNLRSYAYEHVMKQADKEGSFSSGETLPFRDKTKFVYCWQQLICTVTLPLLEPCTGSMTFMIYPAEH